MTLQVEHFLQDSREKEKQARIYNDQLDEARENLLRSTGDSHYALHYDSYDTLHPSKFLGMGSQGEQREHVRQNMFLPAHHPMQSSYHSMQTLGGGTTGSSLGYGQNQSFGQY